MRSRIIKLLLLLLVATVALGFIFWSQFKKTRGIVTQTVQEPLVSAEMFEIPVDQSEPLLNPGAPLSAILFVDLGDVKSRALANMLITFAQSHPQDVQFTWKDAPQHRLFSPDPTPAHRAAWCANDQHRFWEFIKNLLASNRFDEKQLVASATAAKLDLAEWNSCRTTTQADARLSTTRDEANALGLTSFPALFLNNKKINTSEDVDMEQMLTSFIAK